MSGDGFIRTRSHNHHHCNTDCLQLFIPQLAHSPPQITQRTTNRATHTQKHTHSEYVDVGRLRLRPHPCACASSDKVSDSVMAVQISWMMEAPQLYRQCYDKAPQLEPDAAGYEHPPNTPESQHSTPHTHTHTPPVAESTSINHV